MEETSRRHGLCTNREIDLRVTRHGWEHTGRCRISQLCAPPPGCLFVTRWKEWVRNQSVESARPRKLVATRFRLSPSSLVSCAGIEGYTIEDVTPE